MADGPWTSSEKNDLLRQLDRIATALEAINNRGEEQADTADGTEERPIHMKYVPDELVAVSAYFEGGDPRPPLPTIGAASVHEGTEHVWPAELTPDAVCEVDGCHQRYADWTATT